MTLVLTLNAQGQTQKNAQALKIDQPLTVDGYLNEKVYQKVKPATDFVQLQPYNGKPSFQPSEVYFFYDQSAIYLGAMLYDSSPDSIFNFISNRDNIGMSDYFGVYFDPYNKGQLAYGFFITPAGSQTDIKAIKKEYDYEDPHWNAVWESKTRISENGWIIEMRIPYSALRFPDKEEHVWGLNMFRNIRRYNSNNSWSFINREVSGFIHQQGELTGIKNIEPPVRLSVSPYVSGYIETKGDGSSPDVLYKGGMDLKYGINESFTLDMMLIPDFGQIQSDDKELNLSPFELYYDEKRQFFTEGIELFQRADIFYSRRIGDEPKFQNKTEDDLLEEEKVEYNPTSTRLVNATKISGRTTNGWGIGLLNAMTWPAYAELKDTLTGKTRSLKVQPFTNFNVAVVDKSLKNNSYVSLINTNMAMNNHPFSANVTATEFQLRDKNKIFAVTGNAGISTRTDDEKETGGFGKIEFEKNSGKFNFGVSQKVYSKDYNPNDMGYLRQNNQLSSSLYCSYHIVEPFAIFREWHANAWYDYSRIVQPNDKYQSEIGVWNGATFKNNYGYNANAGIGFEQHNYYEARIFNWYYYEPYHYWLNGNIYTDRRKPLSFDANLGGFEHPTTNERGIWGGAGVRLRIGQRLNLDYDFYLQKEINDKGYVDNTENEDTIYFGKRNIKSIENELEMDFSVNSKLSIIFRARHYWSGVEYSDFFQLQRNGRLQPDPTYNENHDTNYNIFNIDMAVKWHFAPGAEMSLAWKNAVFENQDAVFTRYRDNIKQTFEANQVNSVSLKILYYIDYNMVKNNWL